MVLTPNISGKSYSNGSSAASRRERKLNRVSQWSDASRHSTTDRPTGHLQFCSDLSMRRAAPPPFSASWSGDLAGRTSSIGFIHLSFTLSRKLHGLPFAPMPQIEFPKCNFLWRDCTCVCAVVKEREGGMAGRLLIVSRAIAAAPSSFYGILNLPNK